MANSNIDIRIRTFIEGLAELNKLGQELKNTAVGAKGVGEGTKPASAGVRDLGKGADSTLESLKRMQQDLQKLSGGLGDLTGLIKKAVVAFVAFAGVAGLKAAADAAARVETLGITLGVVALNAGYSKEQISGFEEEVVKMGITSSVARDSLTKLIQAGIELSTVNEKGQTTAAALARASQDLAVITGQNSSETLQRLIVNIQQLDTVGLRYQGLIVNREAAEAKFAATLGKTASQLSQQQKTQAFLNAAMAEAGKLTGSYEKSLDAVGKKLSSLARLQEELSVAIGDKLLPAYAAVVEVTDQFLKDLRQIALDTDSTGEGAARFGAAIRVAAQAIADLVLEASQLFASAATGMGVAGEQLGLLLADILSVVTATLAWVKELGVLNIIFVGIGAAIALIRDAFSLLLIFTQTYFATAQAGLVKLMEQAEGFARLFDEDLANTIREIASDLRESSEENAAAAEKSRKAFEDGDSALRRYAEGLSEVEEGQKKVNESAGFQEITEGLRGLVEQQRLGQVTSFELADRLAALDERLNALAGSSTLAKGEFERLQLSINSVRAGLSNEFNKALTDLGFGFVKLGDESNRVLEKMNKEVGTTVASLQLLGSSGEVTRAVFTTIFADGLNSAKSLADILGLVEATNNLKLQAEEAKIEATELAEASVKAAEDLAGATARNRAELSKAAEEASAAYALSIARAQELSDALAESTALATQKFYELFDAQLAAASTNADIEKLRLTVEALGTSGVLTGEQVAAALDLILTRAGQVQESLIISDIVGPLKALGTTFAEVTTQITEDNRKIIEAFGSVAASGKLAGDALREVFSGAVENVDSIEALQELSRLMEEAQADGEQFGESYSEAVELVSLKFDELFQSLLKTAKTQEDFDRLRETVKEFGDTGTISSDRVSRALQSIAEQADNSRERMAALSSQFREVAEAESSLGRAQNDISRANLDLGRAIADLRIAELQDKRESTALSRAEVDVQKAIVAEARAKKELAELQYEFERVQLQLILGEHKKINAELALRNAKTDEQRAQIEGVIAALVREAETRVAIANGLSGTLAQQGLIVDNLALARERAERLADSLRDVEDAAGGAADAAGDIADALDPRESTFDLSPYIQQLIEFGYEAGQATELVDKLLRQFTGFSVGASARSGVNPFLEELNTFIDVARRAKENTEARAVAQQKAEDSTRRETELMRELQSAAQGVAESAAQAALSFLGTVEGIRNELLRAKGLEDQIAKERFEARRRDLDLEYLLLQVKIQQAIVQARSAGLFGEADQLESLLEQVSAGYQQSIKDLEELRVIELAKIADKKKAEATAAKEKSDGLSKEASQVSEIIELTDSATSALERQRAAELLRAAERSANLEREAELLSKLKQESTSAAFGSQDVSDIELDVQDRVKQSTELGTELGGKSSLTGATEASKLGGGDINFNVNGSIFGTDPSVLFTELARKLGPEISRVLERSK